jgi:hypothetical protein
MTKLVTPDGTYRLLRFDSEKEFERSLVSQVSEIFGSRRIYLDCKRRIGGKNGRQSVPDAYLLDLSRPREPQLYVVENEISSHDLFRHIGVQLLQFSVSYGQAGRLIKQVLFEEITANPAVQEKCERYAREGGFRNLDHFLDAVVFDTPFRALVIIDEETEELHTVLKNLGFPVEVIEFSTYQDERGRRIFKFAPFLADVESVEEIPTDEQLDRDLSKLDTIVVPAHDDGFLRVFIDENRWWAVRIHPTMAAQLKYVAAYRVAPISAITHFAPIRSIEPWKDTGKMVINFSEPAKQIKPVALKKGGKVRPLQGLRYTSFDKLNLAKTLDEAF